MKKRSARKAISMGGQPTFSWQLQEDSQSTALVDQPPAQPRSARLWLLLASIMALILLGGYFTWQRLNERAESNLALVEVEVAEAFTPARVRGVSRDRIEGNQSNRPAPVFFIAGDDSRFTLLELFGSLALVDVTINDPSEAWYESPYHVARIVQQEVDGWKQIAPNNTFWNERRTLDTTYFRMNYGRRDHAAVQEVAANIDELYLQLHDDLGLPTPRRSKRVDLHIAVVEGSEVRVTDVRYSGDTLYIPPPEMIPRPVGISDGETLRQAIALPLSTKVFNLALNEHSIPCYWRSLAEGIGLWLRWENHTLPSRRHWEYQRTIQSAVNSNSLPSLGDLRSIPRDCWQPPPFLDMGELNAAWQFPRNELSATLIEYMVATYGRQSVGALLHHMRDSADWNSLALESVNITADELEAGWHDFLEERTR
jgi:hypothetical protein